jgi:hypothetical protein
MADRNWPMPSSTDVADVNARSEWYTHCAAPAGYARQLRRAKASYRHVSERSKRASEPCVVLAAEFQRQRVARVAGEHLLVECLHRRYRSPRALMSMSKVARTSARSWSPLSWWHCASRARLRIHAAINRRRYSAHVSCVPYHSSSEASSRAASAKADSASTVSPSMRWQMPKLVHDAGLRGSSWRCGHHNRSGAPPQRRGFAALRERLHLNGFGEVLRSAFVGACRRHAPAGQHTSYSPVAAHRGALGSRRAGGTGRGPCGTASRAPRPC